jgi:acetyl esterase/lipase
MSAERPVRHLPARDIPVPTSISEIAQAVMGAEFPQQPAPPPLADLDGWRAMIAAHDANMGAMLAQRLSAAPATATVTERDIAGVRVYEVVPEGLAAGDTRLYIDIHGGAFVFGAGEMCKAMGIGAATRFGARVWAVDYRMPPDHPFPAAGDDCLAVYRAALEHHRPEQIAIGGSSAGGNLAAVTALRARDLGLPMPAAVVLNTPGTDLTNSGDSMQTNMGLDNLLDANAIAPIDLYVGDHDPRDPYMSPLYADFTKGFPPTVLTTGTRDLLLSDTVRMHRALRNAGVVADLHVTEAAGHGGFFGMAPEDDDMLRLTREFIERYWRA